jgi:drug/metabolite transporter (DMT)-like permease
LWGVSGFAQKLSTNHISGELSALSFLAVFIPIALIILLVDPLRTNLPRRIWLLSAALGLCFAWGNFAILKAFANNGKASIIAPLGGLYPLISVPIALVAFREKLGVRETIGIVTALLAIIALSLETRHPATQVSRAEPVLK